MTATGDAGDLEQDRRLLTLERLLAIQATGLKTALDQASQLVTEALGAEKADAFLHDPTGETLVALGTSATPMGQRQHAIGLDRLPLANRGRVVEVYVTGRPYITGHADEDPEELPGIVGTLGIRSTIATPLEIAGARRGVLQASSSQPERFSERDLRFLQAVAGWVGMVAHRAELVEQVTAEAAEQGRRVAAEELITILAHDLRNPLQTLAARLGLLRQRARREGHSRYVEDAEAASRAVERLTRMITDLLDVGRLTQGLFTVSPRPVDVVALVAETAQGLQTPTTRLDVRAPDEAIVNADPERLRQAVDNLLANAVRHSPAGMPVTVTVATETREDGQWAVITVRDQGPGISPALLPRLFTRFAPGPDSTGLGLGLYLARSIAEAHGGTLTVDTAATIGTGFQLALPAEGSPDTPPEPSA